jgi:hypothetical protein
MYKTLIQAESHQEEGEEQKAMRKQEAASKA